MDQSKKNNTYDTLIIGCGLSGLMSALHLQEAGVRVGILEKLDRYGGLCGTKVMDGYEFVIACNDFGLGMEREFKRFKIPIIFHKPGSIIFYKDKRIVMPLRMGDLLKGWRWAFQITRYLLKVLFPRLRLPAEHYLGALVDRTIKEPALNDLLKLPAYLMGVKPSEFKVDALVEDFKYKYGYRQPTTPTGGPQALIDKLVERVSLKGGDIHLKTEVVDIKSYKGLKVINTCKEKYYTKHVILTSERKAGGSSKYKEGLPISMYCLALDKEFIFPDNVHTMVHYPPDPERWFGMLDAGQIAKEFGFHIFRSDLPEKADHYTINAYFYLPRGIDDPDREELSQVDTYIFEQLEKMLPGINKALKYKRFISPGEFVRMHRLSSRVTSMITPAEIDKPPNYDRATDLYYAGNSCFPPGDHAGAAILSGKLAADAVKKRLKYRSQ